MPPLEAQYNSSELDEEVPSMSSNKKYGAVETSGESPSKQKAWTFNKKKAASFSAKSHQNPLGQKSPSENLLGQTTQSRRATTVPAEMERLPSTWAREYEKHGDRRTVLEYWRRNVDK